METSRPNLTENGPLAPLFRTSHLFLVDQYEDNPPLVRARQRNLDHGSHFHIVRHPGFVLPLDSPSVEDLSTDAEHNAAIDVLFGSLCFPTCSFELHSCRPFSDGYCRSGYCNGLD